MKKFIEKEITDSIRTKEKLFSVLDDIVDSAKLIQSSLKKGNKIILFGNGGSAADSQHIAAEFIGKFMVKRKSLAAMALTTNTSSLTAIANDLSFDDIFARQLEGIAKKGDVVIGITTSGKSKNVIDGIKMANKIGCHAITLTGNNGRNLAKISDVCIAIPSTNTQRIQECHILVGHILCGLIENNIVSKKS